MEDYPIKGKEKTKRHPKSKQIIRGITLLLLLGGLLPIQAKSYSQEPGISLDLKNVSLKTVFSEIERCSEYIFVLSGDISKEVAKKVNVHTEKQEVGAILNQLLSDTELRYEIFRKQVVVCKKNTSPISLIASEQNQDKRIRIKGVVTDTEKFPLIGVTIKRKGSEGGYTTNNDGQFQCVVKENDVLVFSYVGFKSREIKIKKEETLCIVLEEDIARIKEVVVTGIFKRKGEDFTGSTTKVTGEEIQTLTSGNMFNAIQQIDPSFKINENNLGGANPSIIPNFNLRGKASMGEMGMDRQNLRGDYYNRPNQPLFVLDGIIGVSVSKIIDLDPALIESVTILKDATALVLYGSRAANGVVVVETKAPRKGKLRFEYYGKYRMEYPDLRDYNLLNAREKIDLEWIAGVYDDHYDPIYSYQNFQNYNRKVMDVERGVNTYWLSQPLTTAFQHTHTLSIEGGDEQFRYKLSVNVGERPGVMKKTGLSSKNGSLDIRYRSDKIHISNQLFTDYNHSKRTSPYGIFSTYTTLNPYYRIHDEKGNYLHYLEYDYELGGDHAEIPFVFNPLYDLNFNQRDISNELRIGDRFNVEYRPVKNISLSLGGSLQKSVTDSEDFLAAQHSLFAKQYDPTQKGHFKWGHIDMLNYTIYASLDYNKYIKDHFFSTHIRQEIESYQSKYTLSKQTGFPNDLLDEYGLGAVTKEPFSEETNKRTTGFLVSSNYAFRSKYAIDLSMRIDASSEFGRNNRYAPFWSGGVRWNAEREEFIKKLGFIDELTFRATYGTLGSQGISPYQAYQMYKYDLIRYPSSDVIGAYLSSIGNKDLKWESSNMYNTGVDFSFFDSRISGRVDYYIKNTSNLIIDYSLQASTGFNTIVENMGNMRNKGVDIFLNVMPYFNRRENIFLTLGANANHNRNKILKISDALKQNNERTMEQQYFTPFTQYVEGHSVSEIWGPKSLGIDPITGYEVFEKKNGEKTYIYDKKESVSLGNREPILSGTVFASFNYKNLMLTLSGMYSLGADQFNKTMMDKVENTSVYKNLDRRALTERWQKPGDIAPFKKLTIDSHDTFVSSRFVMKENFFMLKAVNLQYRMNADEYPFLKRLNVSLLTAGIYFEDLIRLSTIKQERGIQYPFTRQVSCALGITF